MSLVTGLEAKEVVLEGKVAWVDTFLDHCNVCSEYGHKAAQWLHCDLNHRAAQCTYNLVKGNGKGGHHMTSVKGVRVAKRRGKKGQHVAQEGKDKVNQKWYLSVLRVRNTQNNELHEVANHAWPLGVPSGRGLSEVATGTRQ